MQDERTEKLTVYFTPEEVSILDQLAKDQNKSRDEIIGTAIQVMKESLITNV